MGIGFLFFGGEYVSFWGDENVLLGEEGWALRFG